MTNISNLSAGSGASRSRPAQLAHRQHARARRSATARPVADAQVGGSIAAFYRSRGGAPLWFSPTSGASVQNLMLLLSTAQADGLNPNRYNVRGLTRVVRDASRGNPAAVQRAEVMLSEAFVTYARDQKRDPNVGIIYVDPEVRPTAPSAATLLAQRRAPRRGPNMSSRWAG